MVKMEQEYPNCRATGVGSTPHTDSATAVDFVLQTFPDVPHWPQLPRRTFRENMYVQFSQHLPGVCVEDEEERIWVELNDDWLEEAEPFYAAFLEEDPARFAPSPEYAAGLYELLQRGPLEGAWAIKGQVTGPISSGLQVTDQHLRPSLYDDMMRDVIIKNVLRHAQWQEAQLRALCRPRLGPAGSFQSPSGCERGQTQDVRPVPQASVRLSHRTRSRDQIPQQASWACRMPDPYPTRVP